MRRPLAVALALLLVTAGVVGTAVGQTRTTIDSDHALTSDEKQSAFVESGSASADITAPNMTVTVASEHETCGIDGFNSDIRNDYLCIDYAEDVDRTIRIHIPAEYWTPYLRQSVDPVAGDATAAYEPVNDASATAVTVTLDESGTYAWPVTKETSFFAERKKSVLDRVSNVTGVGVPSSDEWQYIDAAQLGGNESAYVLTAPNGTDAVVLEYKTDAGEWAAVPDESQDYAPVYYETKTGVDERVYVFATVENPPEVRYKTEAGSADQFGSALREISQVPTRLEDILGVDLPFVGN